MVTELFYDFLAACQVLSYLWLVHSFWVLCVSPKWLHFLQMACLFLMCTSQLFLAGAILEVNQIILKNGGIVNQTRGSTISVAAPVVEYSHIAQTVVSGALPELVNSSMPLVHGSRPQPNLSQPPPTYIPGQPTTVPSIVTSAPQVSLAAVMLRWHMM